MIEQERMVVSTTETWVDDLFSEKKKIFKLFFLFPGSGYYAISLSPIHILRLLRKKTCLTPENTTRQNGCYDSFSSLIRMCSTTTTHNVLGKKSFVN